MEFNVKEFDKETYRIIKEAQEKVAETDFEDCLDLDMIDINGSVNSEYAMQVAKICMKKINKIFDYLTLLDNHFKELDSYKKYNKYHDYTPGNHDNNYSINTQKEVEKLSDYLRTVASQLINASYRLHRGITDIVTGCCRKEFEKRFKDYPY